MRLQSVPPAHRMNLSRQGTQLHPVGSVHRSEETFSRGRIELIHCLNPRVGNLHDNPPQAVTCRSCDFLVQGARISNYEVIAYLGTGSFGHVYQVREPAPLSRVLALKVLRVEQMSEKTRDSFFDEAQRI